MQPSTIRRTSRAFALAALALTAGLITALPDADASPLSTARYTLTAADGTTIEKANCLADTAAAANSFCQHLTGRNDGTKPPRSGTDIVRWIRDARTAGAAAVTFTESGDGFTGDRTYTIPATDTVPYGLTSVGRTPPARTSKTRRYEITSVNDVIAESDCLNHSIAPPPGATREQYERGAVCVITSLRPIAADGRAARKLRAKHAS